MEKEILKDKPYYKTGGGVTFSGGEPLLQIKFLEPLLKKLKNNINIAFETALFTSHSYVNVANQYADELIVDLKMLDPQNTKNIIGGNIETYLNNLKYIDLNKTTFRIPVTEFNLNDESSILDLLTNYKSKKVEIFKLHNLAKRKYELLGKDYYYEEVSDKQLVAFKDKLNKIVPTEIIEI